MTTESTTLNNGTSISTRAPTINYLLKSKMAITLHLQLCSVHYTALQACEKLICLNPIAMENAGKKSKGSRNTCPNNQSRTESEVAITLHL